MTRFSKVKEGQCIPFLENDFIGVFDSGAGGISVLAELVSELPCENFLYFGDGKNIPYGNKPKKWIESRSHEIADDLILSGAKAVVIACNTATAAAAESLRKAYPNIPVIGIEPALKPAVLSGAKDILVMATPATLSLDKYRKLEEELKGDTHIVDVVCAGLAERIEQEGLNDPYLDRLLESLIGKYRGKVDAVVLGCTHYPLAKPAIRRVLGNVPMYDGGCGTARQLRRKLAENELLFEGDRIGNVEIRSSGGADMTRSYCLLYEELIGNSAHMENI